MKFAILSAAAACAVVTSTHAAVIVGLAGASRFDDAGSVMYLTNDADNFVTPGYTSWVYSLGESATGGSSDGTWGSQALPLVPPANNGFASTVLSLHLRADPGSAPMDFNSIVFDYRATAPTAFDVGYSLILPTGQRVFFTVLQTVQVPAATADYQPMIVDLDKSPLGNFAFEEGWTVTLSINPRSFSEPHYEIDNFAVMVNAVPEPGSMVGLSCLLGAGAFVRRRS